MLRENMAEMLMETPTEEYQQLLCMGSVWVVDFNPDPVFLFHKFHKICQVLKQEPAL